MARDKLAGVGTQAITGPTVADTSRGETEPQRRYWEGAARRRRRGGGEWPRRGRKRV